MNDGAPADEVPVEKSVFKEVFLEYKRSTNALLAMAIGLCSSDDLEDSQRRKLSDTLNDLIYKQFLNRSFQPVMPLLKKETNRCSQLFGRTVCMASALKPACLKWLEEHPVTGPTDIAFLRREEGQLHLTLLEAQHESDNEDRARRLTAHWGIDAWSRFHYCCNTDEAVAALAHRDCALTRQSWMEGTNNEDRSETFAI